MIPYSDATPLGYCASGYEANILGYVSWESLAASCRSGRVLSPNNRGGYSYVDVDDIEKQSRPCVVYKGDYADYRDLAHFGGSRSPYVFIDVDFDEDGNGISKSEAMSDPAVAKRIVDEADLVEFALSQAFGGAFFSKRSSSRSGIHHVLRIHDMPPDIHEAKGAEAGVFDAVGRIMGHLNTRYKYRADYSAASTARVMYINRDPDTVYDPTVPAMSATAFPVSVVQEYHTSAERREPGDSDRNLFSHLAYCSKRDSVRLEHGVLFELAILYFQLWPDDNTPEHKQRFLKLFRDLNHGRSLYRGNKPYYLERMYEEGRDSAKDKRARKIGMTRLHRIADDIVQEHSKKIFDNLFKI